MASSKQPCPIMLAEISLPCIAIKENWQDSNVEERGEDEERGGGYQLPTVRVVAYYQAYQMSACLISISYGPKNKQTKEIKRE